MESLRQVLTTAAGMFLVLGGWILIQVYVRRQSACRNPDKDVLDFMLDGCGGNCRGKGACHSGGATESHPHDFEAHHETL